MSDKIEFRILIRNKHEEHLGCYALKALKDHTELNLNIEIADDAVVIDRISSNKINFEILLSEDHLIDPSNDDIAIPLLDTQFSASGKLGDDSQDNVPTSNMHSFYELLICAKTLCALEQFLAAKASSNHLPDDGSVREVLTNAKTSLLKEQANLWLNYIEPSDKAHSFLLMAQAWQSKATAIAALANASFYRPSNVLPFLLSNKQLFAPFEQREIRTIAFYYHRLRDGGTERVIAELSNRLTAAEYESAPFRLIIITDDEPSSNDYPLSPNVTRLTVPHRNNLPSKSYEERGLAFRSIADEYKIDALIYAAWVDKALPWDMINILTCRNRPAFIVHCHNIAATLWRLVSEPLDTLNSFAFADALVCLSESDRWYWANINSRVRHIDNPVHLSCIDAPRVPPLSEEILWLGRLSQEKQPEEALEIARFVLEEHPDAHLTFVGSGSPDIVAKLKARSDHLGIRERVYFEGPQSDVAKYYNRASLLLVTSLFEGSLLTLYEAAASGLPIVMYNLPYLSFCVSHHGWIGVHPGDRQAAANAICTLLEDPVQWKQASDELRESYSLFSTTDPTVEWKKLFADISDDTGRNRVCPAGALQLNQMAQFHLNSMQAFKNKLSSSESRLAHANEQIKRADQRNMTVKSDYATSHKPATRRLPLLTRIAKLLTRNT